MTHTPRLRVQISKVPESSPDGRIAVRHYGFLVFLTFLNVMNFVDRQLLASFANFIVPELGLTNTQFGWLTGFAFIAFYSVMGLFAGALADVVHRPRLVSGALTLWSTLTAASGAAVGFLSLVTAPLPILGVYGALVAFGAMWALALSLFALPAALLLLRPPDWVRRHTPGG